MPALGYKSALVMPVWNGTKPHTIRGWRRRPFKVGDVLQHYTAMRTRQCKKIRPDTTCTAAVPIEVNAGHRYVILGVGSRFYPAGRLPARALEELAHRDGFGSVAAFFIFFTDVHGGILCGQLIEWDPFAPSPGATREIGEPARSERDGRVYLRPLAPLSPVRSRPAAAGKREPRGPASAGLQPATLRAKKPGRNFRR